MKSVGQKNKNPPSMLLLQIVLNTKVDLITEIKSRVGTIPLQLHLNRLLNVSSTDPDRNPEEPV